jgi:hypothetical protein
MAKARTTWREKLEKEQEPKVVYFPNRRMGVQGRVLIPRPLDVDALIRRVQRGRLVTVNQLRERLAEEHGADGTCPLTAGIFIWIVAETAEEDLSRGREEVTPYWRVVKANGGLNPKFPGGVEAQAARLREEGHIIEAGKGKNPPVVRDFEKALQRL